MLARHPFTFLSSNNKFSACFTAVSHAQTASKGALGCGPPPWYHVGAHVMKYFYTDTARQTLKAFSGVVADYSIIEGTVW